MYLKTKYFIALLTSKIILNSTTHREAWHLWVCQSHTNTILDHQSPVSHATRQVACDSQNCMRQISKKHLLSMGAAKAASEISTEVYIPRWLRVLQMPHSFAFGLIHRIGHLG